MSSEDRSISSGLKEAAAPSNEASEQKQREVLQHEQRRLQEEFLRESEASKAGLLPGEEALEATSEADAKSLLQRRIRLERYVRTGAPVGCEILE